jgi:predicted metal-dependent HD superfamily phosphohydrolase
MRFHEAINHIVERLRKELSPSLHYHCLEHTLNVMQCVREICASEDISESDQLLVDTAAAYHDCGFLWTYNDHEQRGCEYVASTLPEFGYSPSDIDTIQNLIMSTKIPQMAESQLAQILCDADLDYLGKGDGSYDRISEDLRKELIENGVDLDKENWLNIQIDFLKNQRYFTDYAKTHREEKKSEVLQRLIDLREKLF